MSYSDSKLRSMKLNTRELFSAALDVNEGKISPQQLKSMAQRAEWKSRRFLHPGMVPAGRLDNYKACIFTAHATRVPRSIGNSLLAEKERPWMVDHKKLPLEPKFVRMLLRVEPCVGGKDLTRKTRLDFIINHVFEKLKPEMEETLHLETDLEFTYGSISDDETGSGLYGVPFYTLWYGPRENLGIYLVVVHTNKPAFFDTSEIQTYMGMIHAARRRRGDWNCRVYGLATNSREFWFYHVDNGGEWSYIHLNPPKESPADYFSQLWLNKNMQEYFETVAGILAYIFREAIILSYEAQVPNMTPDAFFRVEPLPGKEIEDTAYESLKSLSAGVDTWIN